MERSATTGMIPSNIEISSKRAIRSLSSSTSKTKHHQTSPTFSKPILSKHVGVGKFITRGPDLHASSLTEATAMLAAEDSFQTFVDEYAECDIPDDGVSSLGDPSALAPGETDFRASRPTRQRGSILTREKIFALADREKLPSASRKNRQGRRRNRARSFDDTVVEDKLDVSRHSAGRYSADDVLYVERRLESGNIGVEDIKTKPKASKRLAIDRPKRSKSVDRTVEVGDGIKHEERRRRPSPRLHAARSRSLGRPARLAHKSEKHANLSDKSLWSGQSSRSFRRSLPEATDNGVGQIPCRADTSSRSFPPTGAIKLDSDTAASDLLEAQKQLAEEKERNSRLTKAFKETRFVAEKAITEVRKLQEINTKLQAQIDEKTDHLRSSDDGNKGGSITHAMAIRLHKRIAALEAENERLRSKAMHKI